MKKRIRLPQTDQVGRQPLKYQRFFRFGCVTAIAHGMPDHPAR
jgi:hypothetical protein